MRLNVRHDVAMRKVVRHFHAAGEACRTTTPTALRIPEPLRPSELVRRAPKRDLIVPFNSTTLAAMATPSFARTPEPPYYAVIFTSQRTEGDNGYAEMGERMAALAAEQPGYLGAESARDADGFGITVSYWESEDAILAWRRHAEHTAARERGRALWYDHFELRIARVERAYGWDRRAAASA